MRDEKRMKAAEQGNGMFLGKTDTGGMYGSVCLEEIWKRTVIPFCKMNWPYWGFLVFPTPEPRSFKDFSSDEKDGSEQGTLVPYENPLVENVGLGNSGITLSG